MMRARLVALACLALTALVPAAFPVNAAGAINSVMWAAPVYQGYDAYYGSNVVAVTAGSTANVTVQVSNDQDVEVTIREARITLDWGADVAGAGPAELQPGETGTFTFAVAVPPGASNTALHTYQVKVGYQRQGVEYTTSYRGGDPIGNGDGASLQFYASSDPILQSSLEVYWRDTIPNPDVTTLQDPSTYVVYPLTGRIIFAVAPPVGTEVYADYQYFQAIGFGNGANTVFYTGSQPVVNGSLQVYVGNAGGGTFTAAAGWTADYETGRITMASAPTSFEEVYATYEHWTRWPVSAGTNLAVYSSDQADAMDSAQQYSLMEATYPDSLFTGATAAAMARNEATLLAATAATEYASGDFAAASTHYAAALTAMQSAIDTLASGTPPVVATDNASNISASSARLNGSMASRGSADNATASFVWGTSPGTYTYETPGDVMSGAGAFYCDLGSLIPGTTYYYKARAVGAGTSYGAECSFTALRTPPTAVTDVASSITDNSARLNGRVTSLGTESSATVSFVWGNAPGGPYPNETAGVVQAGAEAFHFDLSGLTPDLTCYYRARAASGSLVALGDEMTFTTAGLADTAVPQISSVGLSGTTASGITITWVSDEASTSQVEYGLTEEYGSMTALDTGLVTSHSRSLAGLRDGQTYHYRVVSTDASGNQSVSADATFTTAAEGGGGMPGWAWGIVVVAVAGLAGAGAFLFGWKVARH